ncbi:IS256 family transposase, partial [Microbacterium paludicola]
MDLPSNTTTCLVCGSRLIKNGRTAAGTQRWRCPECGASAIRRRPDVTRREQLRQFLVWVTGKLSQTELQGVSARSFRRKTAWCWALEPVFPPVETIHHAIIVDGIWIDDWCLLIALSDTGDVLGWQWSGGESTAAWEALFSKIPAPGVIVTDGGTGIRSALANIWPETQIQRCIFHLQMNVTRELTRNPRLPAGRALRQIALQLSDVHTVEDAITWRQNLETWWQAYGHLTKERSLYDNGQFGFTHKRLRDAWKI